MRNHKKSLAFKLNFTTIFVFLLMSFGLAQVSYHVHVQNTNAAFYRWAEGAAKREAELQIPQQIRYFVERVESEKFKQISAEAEALHDETLIRDWLRDQPSSYWEIHPEWFGGKILEKVLGGRDENLDPATLLFDYNLMQEALDLVEDDSVISNVFLEYVKDGQVFYLVDTSVGPLLIGKPDDEVPDIARRGGTESIPATLYESAEGDWLCTAFEPIIDPETGEAVGMVAVDINMSLIVEARRSFLKGSILLVVAVTAVCILLNLLLVRHIVVSPLKKLTEATCGFAAGSKKLGPEDVIRVDIRSQDEINDLYQEIRGMQSRIVDYTGDLARFTAEKERTETEMRLAGGIQSAMLPGEAPARKEFDLCASMTPARGVGGDFYDYFLIDDNHLALMIADVSGKGIPAALFMMSAMIQLRDAASGGGAPEEILRIVNERICANNQEEMFLTVWFGVLDLRGGNLACCNAGHEYPVLRGADGEYCLFKDKHGLPLGAMEGTRYKGYELTLAPGDAIFVYTDGVPEASNAQNEFFGVDRLIETLNAEKRHDPQATLYAVRKSVTAFVNGAEQFDDLTMLSLEYRGPAADKE